MYTKSMFLSTACLLALATCLTIPATSLADEVTDVERVNNEFYTALNTLFTGDSRPMKEIWSHRDDVTYMGPGGGMQIGWSQIRDVWDEQAAMRLGGQIASNDTHMLVGDNVAIVQCFEQGENLDSEGRRLPVSIRATNIYRREDGAWKMIGHHTDLLPFLEPQSLTGAIE